MTSYRILEFSADKPVCLLLEFFLTQSAKLQSYLHFERDGKVKQKTGLPNLHLMQPQQALALIKSKLVLKLF